MDAIKAKILSYLLAALLILGMLPVVSVEKAWASEGSAPKSDGVIVTVEGEATDFDIMTLPDGNTSQKVESVKDDMSDAGLTVTGQVDCLDGSVMLTADTPEGTTDEEAATVALEIPGVTDAQPDYLYSFFESMPESGDALIEAASQGDFSLASTSEADDPFANISSPTSNNNQYWLYSAGIADAWRKAKTNHKVSIAVLDSSIMTSHEDLSANVLHEYAWDAAHNTHYAEDISDAQRLDSHGTHVAGIACGVANNSVGIAGASYNANLIPVKVNNGNSISTSSVITAYQYVMYLARTIPSLNIRVINLSFGEAGIDNRRLHSVIAQARNQYDIVSVCAGGNGDKNNNPRTAAIYPSDYPECVSVTSLTQSGRNSYWSDYNMEKDISAPGEGITSTLAYDGRPYGKMGGTSMASPLVAGVFALLFAAVPDATADDACDAIYRTANPIQDSINDRSRVSGSHGAIDAEAALNFMDNNHVKHFSDVNIDDWFYYPVGRAGYAGIMNGISGTDRFEPHPSTTREQVACTLYNYLGNGEIARPCSQKDVSQNEWYTNGVNWAISKGYMNGYNSTTFGVGDVLTREQMACIIANVSGADTSQADPRAFYSLSGNEQTSPWARQGMIWATSKGIINGTSGIYLDPQGQLPRAQMAAIIMNAIDKNVL